MCVCVYGVKPKALPPQLDDTRMTGGHDWEFEGSGPGIWDSLCESVFKRKEFGV